MKVARAGSRARLSRTAEPPLTGGRALALAFGGGVLALIWIGALFIIYLAGLDLRIGSDYQKPHATLSVIGMIVTGVGVPFGLFCEWLGYGPGRRREIAKFVQLGFWAVAVVFALTIHA